MNCPNLWIVVPCYNEEKVLPITSGMFLHQLYEMVDLGLIRENSRILFVNDGSSDKTWQIICDLAQKDSHFAGICQSRNRGHQNAVLAGLMEAKGHCDITISIDCDGQDDIGAMTEMVKKFRGGGRYRLWCPLQPGDGYLVQTQFRPGLLSTAEFFGGRGCI